MSAAKLQVLMPMGGLGSRFAKAGYTTPKALIEVDGKPMFMRALDSFAGIPDIQHIFVIRQEHVEAYDLESRIRQQLPDAKIAILDHDTGGAVETCLIGKELIDDNLPITIADCDIFFQSKTYFDKIAEIEATGKPDGMLLTFPSDDPRYSYVELDAKGKAVRTAEKVVISNHAILGGYFFRSGTLFKELAEKFMADGLPDGLKEYFMSHLFNMLLERGGDIEIADIDVMHIFGTPEELDAYNALKQKV
jgi:dTDP-glucose pyrophosphorylase